MPPELLNLFVVIVAFGFFLWLINRFLPMAAPIGMILNVLVVTVIVIYILEYFKIIPNMIPIAKLITISS